MKNFEELETLYKEKKRIDEYIERVKSLAFLELGNRSTALGLKNNDHGRYNFNEIDKIIGSGKLNAIAQTFEDILTAELYKAKEVKDFELSKYQIVVTDK